jgi:PRTRC genetic system protein C
MIDARVLPRTFTYNGVKLPVHDPMMTPEEVKAAYSHQYPELATAAITGPEASGEELQYSFVRAIGRRKASRHGSRTQIREHKLIAHDLLANDDRNLNIEHRARIDEGVKLAILAT